MAPLNMWSKLHCWSLRMSPLPIKMRLKRSKRSHSSSLWSRRSTTRPKSSPTQSKTSSTRSGRRSTSSTSRKSKLRAQLKRPRARSRCLKIASQRLSTRLKKSYSPNTHICICLKEWRKISSLQRSNHLSTRPLLRTKPTSLISSNRNKERSKRKDFNPSKGTLAQYNQLKGHY